MLSNLDRLVDSRNGLVATRSGAMLLAVSGKCCDFHDCDWVTGLDKHDLGSIADLVALHNLLLPARWLQRWSRWDAKLADHDFSSLPKPWFSAPRTSPYDW